MTTYKYAITVNEFELDVLADALHRLVDHCERTANGDDSLREKGRLSYAKAIQARLYLEPQLTSSNTFFEAEAAEKQSAASEPVEPPTPEELQRRSQRDSDLEKYFFGPITADDSLGAWLGGWDAGWISGRASFQAGPIDK